MELKTQCPQCGGKVFKHPTDLNLDSEVTCVGCGRTDKLEQFITPESRQGLIESVQQATIDALSGIPGFKK